MNAAPEGLIKHCTEDEWQDFERRIEMLQAEDL
jgi:hypothetical protein